MGLLYSVVGGAAGAGPGPWRGLFCRLRNKKNANPAKTNNPATAPSVPPTIAPVRLFPEPPSVPGASVGSPLDVLDALDEVPELVEVEADVVVADEEPVLVVLSVVELLSVGALLVPEPIVVGSGSELGVCVKSIEDVGRSKVDVMPSTDV